ncbi:PLP-dependent aminotransferase family protein [Roseovarius autotrophicus]|uniref:aminotransferase-like domain-containing protein n=1 Tax=Roseovarius autotrophicus TaxID=2824121 RepID=UPI001B38CD45|nr:PLP-dependent aminotransferase family protein [Roseovarius autotrophicus]
MTKTERIVDSLRQQITKGVLHPGTSVPSIRRAAEIHGVSRNTVVEAYERLVAMGYLASRRGAGFFVVETIRPTVQNGTPRHVVEAVDHISLLRAQLDQNYNVRVGDGRPPGSWMAATIPRRIFAASADSIADSSGYGVPKGNSSIRELIAARHQSQNIDLSPEQIVTTFGGNHALDLIVRRYLRPGDCVLVDDPGYYPLFAKLKLAQVRFVGVRRGPVGPCLEDLAKKVALEAPKMFFTQSLAQNPTGSSVDLPTAHGILRITEQAGCRVVDDDPFIDLPGIQGVRLATLDQFRNVIFVGTFSKMLSASFRSGYIAAAPDIAAELAELKMITSVNSSRFSELMIVDIIRSRRYQKHLNRIARLTHDAALALAQTLRELDLCTHTTPAQGYYTYLMLPDGVDDLSLAHRAAAEGIFLAPGTFFSVDPAQHRHGIRINVARANDPRFTRFLLNNLT